MPSVGLKYSPSITSDSFVSTDFGGDERNGISGFSNSSNNSNKIFNAAGELACKHASEIVYIGDSYEYDVMGAKAVGWQAILFNPSREYIPGNIADAEISRLSDLTNLL